MTSTLVGLAESAVSWWLCWGWLVENGFTHVSPAMRLTWQHLSHHPVGFYRSFTRKWLQCFQEKHQRRSPNAKHFSGFCWYHVYISLAKASHKDIFRLREVELWSYIVKKGANKNGEKKWSYFGKLPHSLTGILAPAIKNKLFML